jgi:PhoD-like phosphatase
VSAIWFVPGAPLANGAGWRIWYSRPGVGDFEPQPLQILRAGQPINFTTKWKLLAPLADLQRRMGILTVTLDAPAPGQLFDIIIPESGQTRPFQWMAMPDALGEKGIAFLFGSCFWRDNDKVGGLSAALRDLCQRHPRPAFKLLCGDQLYQDWPASFGRGTPLEICAARYDLYWGDPAYQDALRECPNFFLCDDHEFWNDYPEFQVHLERTWTDKSRKAYGLATQNLYEYYQHSANGSPTPWGKIDLGAVSIFISDSRSQRTPIKQTNGEPHFFLEPQWSDLEQWMQDLRSPGVLVIGQPLYQKDGDWKDHSLSNFRSDYRRLYDLISRSHQGLNKQGTPHQILILSGDIHSGRYAVGRIAGSALENEFTEVHELIASASSKIGPYPQKVSIEAPPGKISADFQQPPIRLDVVMSDATGDNNLGLVEMYPGTNGRVRFRLSIWRVRPHDSRSWWDLLRREPEPTGPVIELFQREIQLQ